MKSGTLYCVSGLVGHPLPPQFGRTVTPTSHPADRALRVCSPPHRGTHIITCFSFCPLFGPPVCTLHYQHQISADRCTICPGHPAASPAVHLGHSSVPRTAIQHLLVSGRTQQDEHLQVGTAEGRCLLPVNAVPALTAAAVPGCRLAGDMTHLLSIIVLLLKITGTKSCRGACRTPGLVSCIDTHTVLPVQQHTPACTPPQALLVAAVCAGGVLQVSRYGRRSCMHWCSSLGTSTC